MTTVSAAAAQLVLDQVALHRVDVGFEVVGQVWWTGVTPHHSASRGRPAGPG